MAHAVITDQGRENLDRAAAVHTATLREVFAGFDEPAVSSLDALLDGLREAAVRTD
ncbi:hypothetical protein ACFWVP_32770 [Streptomyces sp. NPDC058637]|uniref:hypothetical protein n=1 Tax=Streptomyces sp. NPDC058637 TaxID=3346569 RepID=UPI00365772BB